MKKNRVPIRPAPSVDEARKKQIQRQYKVPILAQQYQRNKPPPRPPPPKLDKLKSNSALDLHHLSTSVRQQQQPACLIDWSPPVSPSASKNQSIVPNCSSGSTSSSFSGSTSSLTSSKKSFEYDVAFNISPWVSSRRQAPTIIRAQISKAARSASPISSVSSSHSSSPVPPTGLPPLPSPPRLLAACDEPEVVPFAIALYQYRSTHTDDLSLEVDDIVYLTERINAEWYRGRIDAQEGMFPATFVQVQVPLTKPETVLACAACNVLHTYTPDLNGYLNIQAGNRITALYRVNAEWCMGELNGQQGQFPISYVDKLPNDI